MREATGNALLMTMMTSIIAIIMIFFVGSISYSKSYRIKNYIINQIEENDGWNDTIDTQLSSYLKDVGYNVRKSNSSECPKINKLSATCTLVPTKVVDEYEVCVYKCEETNIYYKVITYMKFDFPVIGNSLKFEVTGETRSFNDFN